MAAGVGGATNPMLPVAILPFALTPQWVGCKLMSVSLRGAANLKHDLGENPDQEVRRSPRQDEVWERGFAPKFYPTNETLIRSASVLSGSLALLLVEEGLIAGPGDPQCEHQDRELTGDRYDSPLLHLLAAGGSDQAHPPEAQI